MTSPALTVLYSPFPTIESARAAATAMLEQQVVVCCNLLPGVESHYRWEGALTSSAEVVLIAKTTPESAVRALEVLRSLHPYECPAILSFGANTLPDFTTWAKAEIKM